MESFKKRIKIDATETEIESFFYSVHYTSLSKTGVHVTQNATWSPTVGLEIQVVPGGASPWQR